MLRESAQLENSEYQPGSGLGGSYEEAAGDRIFIDLARRAYESSQTFFDSSYRREFEKAIAHFHSEHAPGSKYHGPNYRKKSRHFRPKTRATIRNNEMAYCVALFSTQDVVHLQAFNDTDKEQSKASNIKGHLLNERLEDPDMNWFMTAMGAAQEAFTLGAVVSRQTWKFKERPRVGTGWPVPNDRGGYDVDGDGSMEIVDDRPEVTLIPLENFRVHEASDWRDPVKSSPFIIEMMPMTVQEIRGLAKQLDELNGVPLYRDVDDKIFKAAIDRNWDSVRRIRDGERVDKYEKDNNDINEFKVLWVHRNIMRIDGYDYVYDTLGTDFMLSLEVRPIEEVYLLGQRPYCYGVAVVEAHRIFPSGIPKLTFSAQEYTNDIANLRQDNLRLTLNKRYWVRRGAQVDILSLRRNVAGGVTLMSNPATDVKESATPDVTSSSYEEQDRINADFDDVAGAFSPSSVNTNRQLNETVGGMNLISGNANMMQEYLIRTVVETWVSRTLRQLMSLIERYESDLDRLTMIAATHKVADGRAVLNYLHMPTKLRVNVGFGATNPTKRIEKMALGLGTLAKFFPEAMQKADVKEVTTEVFGALGYRDGSRFFPEQYAEPEDKSPREAQLEQENAQLKQMLETKLAEKKIDSETRIMVAKINQETAMLKEKFKDNQEGFKSAIKAKFDDINSRLDAAKEERERMGLALEREALSDAVKNADRDFGLRLMEFMAGRQDSDRDMQANGVDKGAKNLKGDDEAGVISRGNYGKLPNSSM